MTANATGRKRIRERNRTRAEHHERSDDPEEQRRQWSEKWDGQQPWQQQGARDDRIVEGIAQRPAERRWLRAGQRDSSGRSVKAGNAR